VIGKERDELLADHAGRAEYPDWNRGHLSSSLEAPAADVIHGRSEKIKKKADAENRVGGWLDSIRDVQVSARAQVLRRRRSFHRRTFCASCTFFVRSSMTRT
jgi:hypothetical protein